MTATASHCQICTAPTDQDAFAVHVGSSSVCGLHAVTSEGAEVVRRAAARLLDLERSGDAEADADHLAAEIARQAEAEAAQTARQASAARTLGLAVGEEVAR